MHVVQLSPEQTEHPVIPVEQATAPVLFSGQYSLAVHAVLQLLLANL